MCVYDVYVLLLIRTEQKTGLSYVEAVDTLLNLLIKSHEYTSKFCTPSLSLTYTIFDLHSSLPYFKRVT